jgi:hypothetical protein
MVQPEMERIGFPLMRDPPLRQGFSRHRNDHQAVPLKWLRFAKEGDCNSNAPSRLNFRFALDPSMIDAKRGDHFLQADFGGLMSSKLFCRQSPDCRQLRSI